MRLLPDDREEGWTPYAWLIYLSFFLVYPAFERGTTPLRWVETIAGAIVFLVLYFRGYWCDGRRLVAIIAAITLLGAIFYPVNPGAGSFFIYAAAFAGFLASSKQALLGILLIEIVAAIEIFAFHVAIWNYAWVIVFVAMVGGINIHYAGVKRSNAKLRLAHDEIERLAKVAERERIARDLHDLLGHTLSLIILKSELASKLADRDIERARGEIRDVERISREALAQVRGAVRGYRSAGLRYELEAARETLTTAGIRAEIDAADVALPATEESVLALAVREAVTNVVRHAQATVCRIAIAQGDGMCIVTIADDGRGGEEAFGTGLRGMRERVESLGGTMTRDGARGTTLTITIAVDDSERRLPAGAPNGSPA